MPKPKSAFLSFDGVSLHFDAVTNEQTNATAKVTEHPVEEGANVADHIRDDLDEVTLELYVTNQPIRDVNNVYGLDASAVELLDVNGEEPVIHGEKLDVPKYRPIPVTPGAAMQAIGNAIADALGDDVVAQVYGASNVQVKKIQAAASVISWAQKFNAITDVVGQLREWKENGVVGSVVMPWKTFPAMVITKVSTVRNAAQGDCAAVSLSLKEIRIVESKLVTAPIPTEARGKTAKAKGRQGTTVVGDPNDKSRKKKSLLKEIL